MAETAGAAKEHAWGKAAPAVVAVVLAAVLVCVSLVLLVGSAGASGQAAAGLDGTVRALGYQSGWVYAGGDFQEAGGMPYANHVARWDGSWSRLGSCTGACVGSTVHAIKFGPLLVAKNSRQRPANVYVGGYFTNVADIGAADRIARFTGTSASNPTGWRAVGVPSPPDNPTGNVLAILTVGTTVYVGGDFTEFGGDPQANYLAKWTPTTGWTDVGGGLDDIVYALAWRSGNLYVGGEFQDAGGTGGPNKVAKWDGANWLPLGDPEALGAGDVRALAVGGSSVFVAGTFTSVEVGGNDIQGTSKVARWNTSTSMWSALDSGLNAAVYALAVRGSIVYVGGEFTDAGGSGADALAAWSAITDTWSAPCDGGLSDPSDEVYALLPVGKHDLYVGGNFDEAGGVSGTANIAKCNAAGWSPLN